MTQQSTAAPEETAGRPRGPRRGLVIALVVAVAVAVVALVGRDVADAVKHVLEGILELDGPALALAVGGLALLETAAFAGLAVPGELAVVLGGVAASDGNNSVVTMASAAVIGAILGDSLGFLFGRRLGTKVLDGRIGRLMGRERVESTMRKIRAGGIKAVVLGRFVGVLRAVMPFAAGASGMSYARFVVASILGAASWGIGFTLLGYAAGSSWQRVEKYVGQASKVLGVVLVIVVVVVVVAKKAAERQDRIRARWQAFTDRPRVAALRARYRRQLGFLVGRFRPGPAAGLQLTVALVGLGILGYLLAVVFAQVLGAGGIVDLDEPVRRELAESRTSEVVEAMETVRAVLSPVAAMALALVVGTVAWVVDRRPRALVLLAGAVGGAFALTELVQEIVAKTREVPSLTGLVETTFPSTRITVTTALAFGLLAVVVPRIRRWTWAVVAVAVAVVVVLLAGLAVLYLAQVYLSDVVGGMVLGALWGVAVTTAIATVWRPHRPT